MVRGGGTLNEYFSFYLAPGSTFGVGSRLVLNGSASPVLNNDEAYVAAFINEIPLGAYATSQLIEQGTLSFPIPAELIGQQMTQPLNLRLEISNQIPQRNCETVNFDNVWTYIDGSSFILSNDVKQTLPSLKAFPYPFAGRDAVRFVLPNVLDSSVIRGAVRLAFVLGFYSSDVLDLGVVADADLGTLDQNLIVLQHGSTATDFSTLLAPLTTSDTPLKPDLSKLDVALYQTLPEPFGVLYTTLYKPDRALLVIASTSKEGFDAAIDQITEQIPPVTVQGTTAIIQVDHPPYVVDRVADVQPSLVATLDVSTPTAVPQVIGSNSAQPSSSVDMSVLIVVVPIMVSLLLILIVWAIQSSNRRKS